MRSDFSLKTEDTDNNIELYDNSAIEPYKKRGLGQQ